MTNVNDTNSRDVFSIICGATGTAKTVCAAQPHAT